MAKFEPYAVKLPTITPATKKIIAYAAICALIFITGLLISPCHKFTPQPAVYSDVAAWQDSVDNVQEQQLILKEKLKKSEAKTDAIRKDFELQKKKYQNEIDRLRTLPPDSLYGIFAKRTGGIDTSATKTYRIPTKNIMQADLIFAERDYLVKDTTVKHEIISALGEQVNLLNDIVLSVQVETIATKSQRDLYKTEAEKQAKLVKKERNAARWIKVGWVASEIATIMLFIAL
jgi:hypothetical protein